MTKTAVCPNCGARFDEMEERCPYCGTTNLTGAKAGYKKKLDGMVDDLKQMKDDPLEETGRELVRSGSRLIRGLVIFAVIAAVLGIVKWRFEENEKNRLREEYIWKQEYFEQMDRFYENRDYERLLDGFEQAVNEKRPIYDYKHAGLCEVLADIKFVNGYLAAQGKSGYSESELSLLLEAELSAAGAGYRNGLREEDLAYIRSAGKAALEDLEHRFGVSPESLDDFGEYIKAHHGRPDYEACRQYVKEMDLGKK